MTTTTSAAQTATTRLRGAILDGRLGPGEHVTETDVARRFEMSRTPVREALRALEAEGLVDLRPGRGAVVVDLRDESLDGLFDLRIRVEGMAARAAARRLDHEQLQRLRGIAQGILDIVERTDGAPTGGDLAQVYDANALFHGLIVAASGSRVASRTFRELINAAVLMRTYQAFDPAAMRRSAAHHLEVVAAFEARDGEWAEAVMTSHLLSARAALLGARP